MSIKEFEDISIPKWKITVQSVAHRVYRVFKNANEFETVEAENASDAVTKSGISKVYMIKYGAADDMYMIKSGGLSRQEAAQPVAAPL